MSKLLRTFDQLFHDEALQGCIAVLHNFPLFLHQLVSRLIGKIQRQLQAILLRMLFLLETVAYAPNGLDLPLLVFKLIHFGPQALDM